MSDRRGPICDYGGVLTGGVATSFRGFERDEDLPAGALEEAFGIDLRVR